MTIGAAVYNWRSKVVQKLVNYKGDWLRKNRGSLMTVAALIVTITFQPAIAPPGGVWQNHTHSRDGNYLVPADPYNTSNTDIQCPNNSHCNAGTAILAYTRWVFKVFVIFDTVSFMASLVVLFLLVIGLPRKNNKLSMWILTIAVCISMSSLGFTFVLGMLCVLPDDEEGYSSYELSAIFSWFGLVVIGTLIMVVLVSRQLIKSCVQRFGGGENDEDHKSNRTTTQEELHSCSTHEEP